MSISSPLSLPIPSVKIDPAPPERVVSTGSLQTFGEAWPKH